MTKPTTLISEALTVAGFFFGRMIGDKEPIKYAILANSTVTPLIVSIPSLLEQLDQNPSAGKIIFNLLMPAIVNMIQVGLEAGFDMDSDAAFAAAICLVVGAEYLASKLQSDNEAVLHPRQPN